ncbi:mannose-6-phosphate isomerase, class I [Luethyella okanaganae]|uniref:mannose-6-phosphate isomerase n=1 Tax=Luethyella okanaganae TaxID=69372 RepID=A0ABW1V9W9_9MICO
MFVAITNTPRDYAWGSKSAIAELLGREPSGRPEAELWLGAHAGSPSRIVTPRSVDAPDLAVLVERDAARALGAGSFARYGARLPFLLKVLAAAAPLSLQAHPSSEQALAGFELEEEAGVPIDATDRNYKDPFHKPELIVALSPDFEALSGFRPVEETVSVLTALRELDAATSNPQPDPLDVFEAHLLAEDPLRDTVEWLLRDGRGEDSGEVSWLVERVVALAGEAGASASPYAREFGTVRDLARAYPGDPGIVLSLLLNRVTLHAGEALYLPAGNIHAYLSGLGIELMAASDNVLRGGLTPKHIDVDELLEVLDFTPLPIPLLEAEHPAPGLSVFRPDVPDFVLYRVEGGGEQTLELRGAAIGLCTSGAVRLSGAVSSASVTRGEALFITPDEGPLAVVANGTFFLATVG